MNSRLYASNHWFTDRQAVIDEIAKQVDEILRGKTTGTFFVEVRGPWGSRNSDVKELTA